MSYKPIFIFASGERCGNGQRFATATEARLSAAARFQRWTMPTGYDVEESDDPVNYKYDNGDVMI
jgi:hypothetical protein